MAPLTPSEMLCFALYSATHAMQASYKLLLDPLGLTYPQYLALSALWAKDGQTVGQLGGLLHLDSNTLTPLLKRLETAGWLTRNRDTGDDRQVRIVLTEAGRTLHAKASQVPGCFAEQTKLDASGLADLRRTLVELRDTLRRP